ncbi:MAG: preprotein translocase subunit SecE [Burkholderiales bacterium]|nr:preprotein translocase subunit SecE [Burkholderiales bacterium]
MVLIVDKIKVAAAVLLVAAGVGGFYYLQESATVIRLAVFLAGLAAGAVVLWTTAAGQSFFAFAHESAAETRKVVWPTRNETLQATAIVFVFVVIMALFLWLVDGILLWIIKKLIGGE